MVETREGLSEKFHNLRSVFESKGMQLTLGSARSSDLKLQRKLLSNAPRRAMAQKCNLKYASFHSRGSENQYRHVI